MPLLSETAYVGVTIFALCGPVGVLIGSCHLILVSSWSQTFVHGHLLIARRAPMCRVATLVSTETAAKVPPPLTSAKRHPPQFSFTPISTRPHIFDCYLQQWTHQRAILTVHRSFRFYVVRTEICLTILYRVHRYPLKSATIVCLKRHSAVQTSAADVFWRWRPHAVIFPRILDHRLSRVRSATDVFVLVDSLAEAFVCIHLGTAFLSLLRHARGQYRGRCRKLVCDFRLYLFSAR